MGEWTIVEYEPSSGRMITTWSFPSFKDAEAFRIARQEFYRSINAEKQQALTPALPFISDAEMELFEKIVANPEWMSRILHQLVR